MATTLTLPSVRFVAQVNTGVPEAKANYKALAQRNALALEECLWSAAGDAVRPSLVEHDFKLAFADDRYDAYLMTGQYDSTKNTEVAYAGMVAYRFALPQAYIDGSATLVSASVMLSRDRFLLPGLRISAVLSDSAEPSTDWSVVRGDAEGCVKLAAQLANPAERITAAEQATGAVTVDLDGLDAEAKRAYLWIYLTVEDYTETWTHYSSTQLRLYAIEGSGMIISQSTTVEFSADVAPDGDSSGGFPILSGGILPVIPHGAALGERHVVVRADANLVAEADGRQTASRAAPGENAAAALSRLFAEFYAGGGDTPSAGDSAYSQGASFNVTRQTEDIPSAESDRPVPTDVLRIDASVLLAPFTWPTDATPTTLTLAFAEPSPSDGARFNVFLAEGYLTSLTQEQLKNPGLYDCRNPPFQLLGSFSSGTTASFKLPATTVRTGTVVISAWFPPERCSLASVGPQGTGANGLIPAITLS